MKVDGIYKDRPPFISVGVYEERLTVSARLQWPPEELDFGASVLDSLLLNGISPLTSAGKAEAMV